MNRELIIALDFDTKEQALSFVDQFDQELFVKVGMELFYACGMEIIDELKKRGHKVFLDLKLHDIPNTVAKAIGVLAKCDIDIVNVHCAGGVEMMAGAVKAVKANNEKALVIAVTQLTSTSKEMMNDELGIEGEVQDCVVKYATLAKEAGLDGVVSSALETPVIKEALGQDFITVTPGIRALEDSVGDQKRVVSTSQAHELGTDYIVVGRSITNDANPVEKYNQMRKEFIRYE